MPSQNVTCSRCARDLGPFDASDRFTAGFYAVTAGYWSRFAREGESFLCDRCLRSDPNYQAEYPGAVPVPAPTSTTEEGA